MADSDGEEIGWMGTTFERKYYQTDGSFVKRSLRPREYKTGGRGLYVPPLGNERLINEAHSLQLVAEHTDVPVPKVHCSFLDDGAFYLVTEFVEGVLMANLAEDQKAVVCLELERHRATLRTMQACWIGGPTEIVIPPYRVMRMAENESWDLRHAPGDDYVFCHNDMSQHNVIVDPDTLRVKAIIDWEYAGFFPAHFDYPFYLRPGPSVALEGEFDDSQLLLGFLRSQSKSNNEQVPGVGYGALQGPPTPESGPAEESPSSDVF
ncbi:hypothetical protein PWT90_07975 [Aphanocladium album]|nr:hypothetical protein PWT90_07975 [Aphanocladium album]